MEDKAPKQTATQADPAGGSNLVEAGLSVLHEFQGLAHDRFRLAALETRRAGESLVGMFVAGVMVAVLLISAWLGLMAAAVLALVENGLEASSAILLAVACNMLLALILCGVIRRKSRYLQFPATVRSLQAVPQGQRNEEKP